MADLSTAIAGVKFGSCIMNGAGPRCGSYEELADIGKSASGAIVTTTMTRDRQESSAPSYYAYALGSVYSGGLPNLGYKKIGDFIPELKKFCKPIVASVAGSEVDEVAVIAAHVAAQGADLVELDLFVPDPDGRFTYLDHDRRELIIKEVRRRVKVPLGIRVSCHLDPLNAADISMLAHETKLDFLTAIAPRELALEIDVKTEAPVLAGNGIGRLAGVSIKPLAMATVRLLREYFRGFIIAAGGVRTGADVFEYLLTGASAVQVGTSFAAEGPDIFSRLTAELTEIMDSKKYPSVGHFIGKLKVTKMR